MRWSHVAVLVAFLAGYSAASQPAIAQVVVRLFGTDASGNPAAVGMTGDALNVVCVP